MANIRVRWRLERPSLVEDLGQGPNCARRYAKSLRKRHWAQAPQESAMIITHFVVFELVLTIEPNLAQLAIDELPGHLLNRKLVVVFL